MPIQEMIAIRNSGSRESNLALLMAMHCAPLMKKLAMANILTLSKKEAVGIRALLKGTDISCRFLCVKGDKVVLYLYREKELFAYLQSETVRKFLKEYGYLEEDTGELIKKLSKRIRLYGNGQTDFPHEIGVFLGYPLPDVKGFIENDGKNFAYMGYWKVYHNVQEAAKLFCRFDAERETAVREVIMGKTIEEIAV